MGRRSQPGRHLAQGGVGSGAQSVSRPSQVASAPDAPAAPRTHGVLPLRTRGLTKLWGHQVGVTDLDIELRPGEVLGLLGPNGAGKTTTLRMLAGLVRPTRGVAELWGVDATLGDPGVRARVGYLPGDLALWGHMPGRELLRFLAALRGGVDHRLVEVLAERLHLDLARRVGELSKGNRQKIGIVQALMHEPDLLILDEPTSGLDPVVQDQFETLVREQTARGVAVLLSSHVLDEVQHLADRAAILRHGNLLTVEDVGDLRRRAARRARVEFADQAPPIPHDLDGVTDARAYEHTLTCRVRGTSAELLRWALDAGAVDATVEDADLEDAFLDLVEDGGRP